MIRSSVDLGTNTCLLLVASVEAGQVESILLDHSEVVRLGEGVDRRRSFSPEAMDRTRACLKNYEQQLLKLGLSTRDTICVATSQARDASNSADFFLEVEKETGFRFRTISGERESDLAFWGALLPGMRASDYCVLDIGGGSTELRVESSGMSLDMGSVRFTERYLISDPVLDSEFWKCQEAIDRELGRAVEWRKLQREGLKLLAVAGTATTLASVFLSLPGYDRAKIDGLEMSRGDLHRLVEELKWRNVEERTALPGMEPKRADVILAGAMILWRVQERLGFESCQVSTRGLRFGAILKEPI